MGFTDRDYQFWAADVDSIQSVWFQLYFVWIDYFGRKPVQSAKICGHNIAMQNPMNVTCIPVYSFQYTCIQS